MNKKALLAHCTTIAKKVARKQLAIENLKKKKGFPMQDCADCEAKNIQWNDMISTQNLQRHIDEDSRAELIKEQDERNAKNTEDLKKLQDEIVQLKNVAKIEEVKMEAVTKSLGEHKEEVRFYKGRLFPDHTPAHGATHAASVSMIGGGGESSPISCSLFYVATVVVSSTTRALTLLCGILTEAHTPRQV